MLNLVSNAIKFTEEGHIHLACRYRSETLHIIIGDSGIGIAESKKGEIFDGFIQADISHKRAYNGAGLGLSITKKLLDLMEGTIEVESQEGVGARFLVRIPMKGI